MVSISSLPTLAAAAGSAGYFSGVRVVPRSGGLSASAVFVFRTQAKAAKFALLAAQSISRPGFAPTFSVQPSSGPRKSFGVVLPLSGAVAPAQSQWFACFSSGRPAAVGALAAKAVRPASVPATAPSWAQFSQALSALQALVPPQAAS